MSEGATREVRIGDRNIVVPRFNGYKATVAGEIVSTISDEWPNITRAMLKFSREYEAENIIRISRAESKMRRYQRSIPIRNDDGEPRLTEEGFVAVDLVPIFTDEDFNEAGFVEIPSSPTTPEQIMSVFPSVWKLAKDEIVRLLALVTAPNAELAEADENGTIDEYLTKAGKRILHEGDIDQIVDALSISVEIVAGQFKGKPGVSGKIAAFIEEALQSMNDSTPTPSKPNSSTDSDAPTDGVDETPSTVQAGASLSGSEN